MSDSPLVLIIEDDADLVRLYEMLLSLVDTAVQTDVCMDGKTGLERVQREPEPRLILLDLHLPKVEGAEIFKAVRAKTSSTIVVVTADVLAAREMLSSADHVVTKPFDVLAFREFLNKLLKNKNQPAGFPGITS
jgi:DNA-binding response OmpR family regulator